MNFKTFYEAEEKLELFLDMDSVITDWNKAVENLGHGKPEDGLEEKMGKEAFWKMIEEEGGEDFWSEMPWTDGGQELWKFSKQFKPTILSSPARHENSKTGKIKWIKRELGENIPYILEKDKFKYAKPNRILVDDYDKKINDWIQHGGIGILHESAADTIKKLKKMFKLSTYEKPGVKANFDFDPQLNYSGGGDGDAGDGGDAGGE